MYECCPECGSNLKIRRWREDDWIVEELKECPMCGWHQHWAYGQTIEDGEFDEAHA